MIYNKRKIIGNTTWMVVNRIYSMLMSLVVGALSARYLGPSNYGLLNYGTSIIAFFTTISELGFASTLVVEMVRRSTETGKILGTALFFRFITSIASFGAVYGIVVLLEPGNTELQVVTMLQAIAVILNTYEVLLYWFQMRLKMQMVTIASMVALTVTSLWRIGLLAHKATIEFFALSNSITALVTALCILFFCRKEKERPPLSIDLSMGVTLVGSSYHFAISSLAVTLYSQLDRIMLGKMISTAAVGYYSAAMNIATMWEFVPAAVINSARPVLTEIKKNNEKDFLIKYKMLLLGINLMALAVGIGIMIFGKLAIYILYGGSYGEAVVALEILVWSTSFSMIGTARTIWIVTENKNKYAKYFTLMGAVINAVLNALVIPAMGITGAAITTLISQIVVAIVAPYLFQETRAFCYLYWDSFRYFPELIHMIRTLRRNKT